MVIYENQLSNSSKSDYATRVNSYEALLTMKNRFSGNFYSQHIAFFTSKYNAQQLKKSLAEEYYLYGNSINATDADSYQTKATLYRKGMTHYKYKDIEQLYKKANAKYTQVASQEFYQRAKDMQKTASTHNEYRQIAALYDKVTSLGNKYSDANKLFEKYQKMGMVKVYYPNDKFASIIAPYFNQNYVRIVDSPSAADIRIEILDDPRPHSNVFPTTKEKNETILMNTIQEKNANGEVTTRELSHTYHFVEHKTSQENKVTLKTMFNINGIYQYSKEDATQSSSSITTYTYTGDVPGTYNDHTEGTLLSDEEILNNTRITQYRFITKQLESFMKTFEKL